MIVVTGAAGFIGSNLVKGLNDRGTTDVLAVDDLKKEGKFSNLVDLEVEDYQDKEEFLARIRTRESFGGRIKAVFHQGACTDTTEQDGRYMMRTNYTYSKILLQYCVARKIPFLYASSAAVYGAGREFREEKTCEKPINVYGYSKLLFDRVVRRNLPNVKSQVVGLRYFNVYGPREQHKERMASMVWHLDRQLQNGETIRLFEGSHGYESGEQKRDFVFVEDLIQANLWFLDQGDKSGIFNLGTGKSRTWNELAGAITGWHGRGEIEYIPFPDGLRKQYQAFTEADLTLLRKAGYEAEFKSIEDGVPAYLSWLHPEKEETPAAS